ncbi:MAG: N-acetylglucosamine kinase [Gammaproteobacteria bacterium]|nr:N-acetylglucosamine kinase [Gammaproteobacteria bacterium]
MSKDIFIGVDGGGTKCKVRIEDEAGNLLAEAKGGPAQINLSAEKAWDSVLTTVNAALAKAQISLKDSRYRFYAGLGLAGTEVERAVKVFLSKPYPFTKVCLKSDGYAACLGAHNGQDGAVVIIGTGVIGWRVQDSDVVQVGGWGFPYSDEGGGAWFGLEAVRFAFQAHDGRVAFSPLLQAVLQKFDHTAHCIDWASAADSTQFAELAPLVLEHVEAGDPWALKLVQQAGREMDKIYSALETKAANKDTKVPYCLFGGVAPFIEPWLSDHFRSNIIPRQNDATVGAIHMIKQELSK